MEFTKSELDSSIAILNDYAANLSGSELSFYVHYWGGESNHRTNRVHKHSFFEICYVADGQGIYEEGATQLPIGPGTLFMSRPHLKHRIVSDKGLYILYVAFELIPTESSEEGARRFQRLEKSHSFCIPQADRNPAVLIWFALLRQALNARYFLHDGILGLASALMTAFENAFSDRHEADTNAVLRASSTLVHKAKLYIRDNLSRELKLTTIADFLHVSPRHLSRLFSENLGQSYSAYVRQERIRQAVSLLTTTEWSIKRIAEETGFDTVHYFTAVFKAEMGEPPGQFLKKLKEQTEMF